MTYRVGHPGGAYVSSQPITRHDYVRADRSYSPPAGYQPAGRQPANGATFVDYLHHVAAGRYHAGYSNFVRGHGVVRKK